MKHLLTLSLLAILQLGWAQSEYCLDGTVWDAALGGCVPEVLACGFDTDLDGDGAVGSSDLLALLTDYGFVVVDDDSDGVCDDIDECVGEYDECGVCNGPGAVYECGCEECGQYVECGDPISYQGYNYATVLIGDQCWFAENLRNELYNNGDTIPANLSDSDWISTNSGATAVHGEESSNCSANACSSISPDGDACDETWALNAYGRLYNWYAVDDARGICPSGWHVPTDGEWMTMEMGLGMSEVEANTFGWRGTACQARQMKTTYGWINGSNNTNMSGFSGLPGGNRFWSNGCSQSGGSGGYWWSSSTYDDFGSNAWGRSLQIDHEDVNRGVWGGRTGLSVRCIQD